MPEQLMFRFHAVRFCSGLGHGFAARQADVAFAG
jgi:hypothetical protein